MKDRRRKLPHMPLFTGAESAPYYVPETMLEAMTRDLEAWRLAKAAIAKAKRTQGG
jgi:hypothetical protein